MNITEFNKEKYGIEGTGITSTTKREINWKDKTTNAITWTIPANAKVHLDFSSKFSSRVFVTYNGETKISRLITAHTKFTGISKPPTLRTLENRCNDGVSKSVTGKKVEPDGYGYEGSPSWELVIGII